MKCPVCRNNQLDSSKICSVCGFSQLQRIFVSEADAEQWMNNVVLPCRNVWEHTQSILDDSRTELEKYRSLYIQTLEVHSELLAEHKKLIELLAFYYSNNRKDRNVLSFEDFLEDSTVDNEDTELPF